ELGIDRHRTDDEHELDEEDHTDEGTDRQVLQEALAQLREVDVEHHDDEEEEHRDRADIDDHEDHRQELGAHQDEQARRVDEGQDQEEHRMHGVARGDDHEGRGHAHARKEIEEGRCDRHAPYPVLSPTGPKPPGMASIDTESLTNNLTATSPVGGVHRDVAGDLALPAGAVVEELFLVVVELLAGLHREFEVRSLDDGIDWAGLLAEAAVDALHHVD